MIYFISDPHGGESMAGFERYLEVCTDSDLLIILGDLGLNFEKTEGNRKFTEWFLSLKIPIAIVDGNHENNAFLQSFPDDTWCGGEVHRLSDTIVHLKRGNIFQIGGKSFFVMGGCKSSDKWKEMGLYYEGEEPSDAELLLAYDNLKKYDNKVDYVLTHKYWDYKEDAPDLYGPVSLEGLTKYIDEKVSFRHWYSGHLHLTRYVDEIHTVVYDEPIVLQDS